MYCSNLYHYWYLLYDIIPDQYFERYLCTHDLGIWKLEHFSRCSSFGSTWQFPSIFVHPGHFQNRWCHTCKDFRKCDWFCLKYMVNTLWFGDFYAHFNSVESFKLQSNIAFQERWYSLIWQLRTSGLTWQVVFYHSEVHMYKMLVTTITTQATLLEM